MRRLISLCLLLGAWCLATPVFAVDSGVKALVLPPPPPPKTPLTILEDVFEDIIGDPDGTGGGRELIRLGNGFEYIPLLPAESLELETQIEGLGSITLPIEDHHQYVFTSPYEDITALISAAGLHVDLPSVVDTTVELYQGGELISRRSAEAPVVEGTVLGVHYNPARERVRQGIPTNQSRGLYTIVVHLTMLDGTHHRLRASVELIIANYLRFVDSQTHTPIENAEVVVYFENSVNPLLHKTTNDLGQAGIILTDGEYYVTVAAPGYPPYGDWISLSTTNDTFPVIELGSDPVSPALFWYIVLAGVVFILSNWLWQTLHRRRLLLPLRRRRAAPKKPVKRARPRRRRSQQRRRPVDSLFSKLF